MKRLLSVIIVGIMLFSLIPTVQASEYMNVYATDGRVEYIKVEDFPAWHAVGWYSAPVMNIYAPDGRSMVIVKSDYSVWKAVGWYDVPVMYAYNLKGETKLIYTSEFSYYHSKGWYSEPVMYVYARDGRKQLVTKKSAPAWKAVGWDYQTVYADNIPWTSDKQLWAIIDLTCGPYSDWKMNRNYYINKYFIEMPESDRLNIKHYSNENHGMIEYLIVPRFKNTVSVTDAFLDYDYFVDKHGTTLYTVYNGIPFSADIILPNGDFEPLFSLKDSDGKEVFILQNLSDDVEYNLKNEKILDLTEWKYHPCYNY